MPFITKLNEIFGIEEMALAAAPEPVGAKPSTLDDFRTQIRGCLDTIKGNLGAGQVSSNPQRPTAPNMNSVTAAHMPPPKMGGDGAVALVERDNEIALDTLKGSIRKMGPKGVSEVISKLSNDKKDVDAATGVATSEFEKFVGGLKQEACEVLLKSTASPSTPISPGADSGAPSSSGTTPMAPQEKLPNLVQTKL